MTDVRYNPVGDDFLVYEDIEHPKVESVKLNMPLFDQPQDISSWASRVTEDGTPIVKDELKVKFENNPEVAVQNVNQRQSNPYPAAQELNYNTSVSKFIINTLMQRLSLTKEQAAGIAGVMMSESGLKPSAFNKNEKAGKLPASSANGKGYGAGLIQWSGTRKNRALQLINKTGNIESLSLEDQLEIVCRELEGPYRSTLNGIRASKTPSEAAATMYCHNVGGFSSSSSPATKSEISNMNKKYKKFVPDGIVTRGMRYAEQLWKE